MQFFFVRYDALLSLPHKQKQLKGLTDEEWNQREAPLEKIYCGFIAWEHIQAQGVIGKDNALVLSSNAIRAELLPHRITPYASHLNLITQLKSIMAKRQVGELFPGLRIALMNGTGTMLGDTVVGSSILERVVGSLQENGIEIIVDVFTAWNARPGVEDLWRRISYIHAVFDSSPTIMELQVYDAYWDFSSLLCLEGYASEHFGDFYLNHFGVNPDTQSHIYKLPKVQINGSFLAEARGCLQEKTGDFKFVFLQSQASTEARSIPDAFLVKLIKRLARIPNIRVLITSPHPKGLTNFERSQIIDLSSWTENNLDRYFALITLSDYVISVDTLALHLAMGAQKPGVGLFSLSDPNIRLKYSPQIEGILILNGEELPYWNKHKHDEQWAHYKPAYESAWDKIDLDVMVEKVKSGIRVSSN